MADYLEMAGQFTLELDNIPRPATLRAFYRRLGRIDAGVLWPFRIGTALLQEGLNDRGIREIVALSTAAQAFEVCIGDVTLTQTDKDKRSRENSVESKGEAALKDIASKVLGVAAGVGAGALTFGDIGPGAIALGLVVGIFSTLTLNWTSKRAVTVARELDYTFIRKRDKKSLERDLPLVIQRVREAGLAPVFMVNELDKLDDAATRVATLIKSLKHLTTDFGCFCFLTDRRYYDELIAKVEREAFPVEHTFFSYLLFILPHPDKSLEYLRMITQSVPGAAGAGTVPAGSTAPPGASDDIARSIFGLFVLHRSKLNLAEVLREIADQCNVDGLVRPSPTDLRRPEYVFAATIQLAIGLILKRSAMRQRVETDPRFMQWAIDALYMVSRAWEKKQKTVKLDKADVYSCLLTRSGNVADPADAEASLRKAGIGDVDLDIICENVGLLAEYLNDCAKLKDALSREGQSDLAEIIPTQNLIARTGTAAAEEYKFLYDMYGEGLEVKSLRAASAQRRPTGLSSTTAPTLKFLAEFVATLGAEGIGIKIPDLLANQILPATIDPLELERARNRLSEAREPYNELSSDLSLVGSVETFVQQNGAKLAAVFRLALQVAGDARKGWIRPEEQVEPLLPLTQAIEAIGRYVDLRSLFQQADASLEIEDRPLDPLGPVPASNVASLKSWGESLIDLRADVADRSPCLNWSFIDAAWARWPEHIYRHFTAADSVVRPAHYADIVSSAANLPPGSLFRRDLRQMNLAEWTELCLSGFPEGPGDAPQWAFCVGLGVLGFGRRLVAQAAEFASSSDEMPLIGYLLSMATVTERQGYVMIMRDDGRSLGLEPFRTLPQPILALSFDKAEIYDRALRWLREKEAIAAVVEEDVEPS